MGVIRRTLAVVPVLPAAAPYIANDQVGAVNTLSNAAANTGGTVEVESVVVIDGAKQSIAMDIFFFDVLPVLVSADNDEFEMTDANFKASCKGVIKVSAAQFAAQKNASMACLTNQGLFLRSVDKSKDLYCVVVTRGIATYGTGDLRINVGIKQGSS